MKQYNIKGYRIDYTQPLLCAPIIGTSVEEVKAEIKRIEESDVEVVEWRIDLFLTHEPAYKLLEMSSYLYQELSDRILLYTLRSQAEGGECGLSAQEKAELLKELISYHHADLIDLEDAFLQTGNTALLQKAHKQQMKVIVSHHDFLQTPKREELCEKLLVMSKRGGDIVKLACMPQSHEDVLTLAQVGQWARKELDCALIMISMGTLGMPARVFPTLFSSVLSFAGVSGSSAPGQLSVQEMRSIWKSLQENEKKGVDEYV
ncbi:type I 3-dehydroquinate dehydratase [Amedibacillus dolichus]|uniref:type I 3-dehydroquinate dehydratase n=1 Tax=Amedibacillus dolichus TaxID=31971 RepID=UPI00241E5045|nr:type I 3-dehydroquinate dehydratase [Amedibacillus dolichus]